MICIIKTITTEDVLGINGYKFNLYLLHKLSKHNPIYITVCSQFILVLKNIYINKNESSFPDYTCGSIIAIQKKTYIEFTS